MTQWFLQWSRKARVIFVFFFARIRAAAAALAYSRCHVLLSCRANIHRSSRSRRRLIRDNTIFLAVAVRDSVHPPPVPNPTSAQSTRGWAKERHAYRLASGRESGSGSITFSSCSFGVHWTNRESGARIRVIAARVASGFKWHLERAPTPTDRVTCQASAPFPSPPLDRDGCISRGNEGRLRSPLPARARLFAPSRV